MNDPIYEALNRSAEECSPEDIDEIIKFIRKSKSSYERGEKPKKEDVKDINEILNISKATVGIIRRV